MFKKVNEDVEDIEDSTTLQYSINTTILAAHILKDRYSHTAGNDKYLIKISNGFFYYFTTLQQGCHTLREIREAQGILKLKKILGKLKIILLYF